MAMASPKSGAGSRLLTCGPRRRSLTCHPATGAGGCVCLCRSLGATGGARTCASRLPEGHGCAGGVAVHHQGTGVLPRTPPSRHQRVGNEPWGWPQARRPSVASKPAACGRPRRRTAPSGRRPSREERSPVTITTRSAGSEWTAARSGWATVKSSSANPRPSNSSTNCTMILACMRARLRARARLSPGETVVPVGYGRHD